jgi:hypothetical protein
LIPKNTKYMRGFAFLAVSILLLTIYPSCSKINDSTEMNIDVISPISLYKLPIKSELDSGVVLATIPVRFNLDSMIESKNDRFSVSNANGIRLNNFEMKITDVDTGITFANYQHIRVTIQGSAAPSNLLASLNHTDSKVKVLNVPVTSTVNDLKSFVRNDTLTYVIRGKLRRPTTKIAALTVSTKYRIELRL